MMDGGGGGVLTVPERGSCHAPGPSMDTQRLSPVRQSPILPTDDGVSGPLLSTDSVVPPPKTRTRSPPHASGTTTPINGTTVGVSALQRSSSTSRSHLHHDGPRQSHRRGTVNAIPGSSTTRSVSTGKGVSKALALHTAPHHAHPRPILPKPLSHGVAHNGLSPPHIIGMHGSTRQSNSLPVGSSSGQSSRAASPGQSGLGTESNPLTQNVPMMTTSFQESAESNLPLEFSDQADPFDFNIDWSDHDGLSKAYLDRFVLDQQSLPPEPFLTLPGEDLNDPSFTYQRALDTSADDQKQSQALLDLIAQSMSVLDTQQRPNAPSGYTGFVPPPEPPDRIVANPYNIFLGMGEEQLSEQSTTAGQQRRLKEPNRPRSDAPNSPSPFGLGVPSELFDWIREQKANQTPQASRSETNDGPSQNPNFIDLSQPLNSADVERILQALQQQQQRQPQEPVSLDQLTGTNGEELFDKYVFDLPSVNNGESDQSFALDLQGIPDLGGLDLSNIDGESVGDGMTWDQMRFWLSAQKGSAGV